MHVGLVWMVERKMTKAQQQVRTLFREIRDDLVALRDQPASVAHPWVETVPAL